MKRGTDLRKFNRKYYKVIKSLQHSYVKEGSQSYKKALIHSFVISGFDLLTLCGLSGDYRKCRDYQYVYELIVHFLGQEARRNLKVIDLGCGSGMLLKFLDDRLTITPYGLDFNFLSVEIAREILFPAFRSHFFEGLVCSYKFSRKFDIIIVELGHISHDFDRIDYFLDHLRKRGLLVLKYFNLKNFGQNTGLVNWEKDLRALDYVGMVKDLLSNWNVVRLPYAFQGPNYDGHHYIGIHK